MLHRLARHTLRQSVRNYYKPGPGNNESFTYVYWATGAHGAEIYCLTAYCLLGTGFLCYNLLYATAWKKNEMSLVPYINKELILIFFLFRIASKDSENIRNSQTNKFLPKIIIIERITTTCIPIDSHGKIHAVNEHAPHFVSHFQTLQEHRLGHRRYDKYSTIISNRYDASKIF